jgi:cell division protein FtsW (lipid II flippase)
VGIIITRRHALSINEIRLQRNLFIVGAVFLGIYSLAISLAPAVRARSWDVDLFWSHWIGFVVWGFGFTFIHLISTRFLKQANPLLLPLVGIISGWGLLTIWRLTPTFGLRQTGWLALSLLILILGIRQPSILSFLRRYKYIWLTSGLLLTSMTLIFGTNPMGYGPRLWLGLGGIYLQPSEPLKLLLVVYLAAYFADWSAILIEHQNHRNFPSLIKDRRDGKSFQILGKPSYPQIQILIPTLIMTGLAILILLVQRDLGTVSIFIVLYSAMVFLATRWLWVPIFSAAILAGAGILGYQIFDVIRLRVDAWINPWLDPSGRSYQIVQSLLAIANGGIIGRGPGLGYPTLVPITHSDFIFSAIAEDGGLMSVVGLLLLLGFLAWIGFQIALMGKNKFHQYLAAGLTTFLAAQSLLIIGGNLRLLPLTGVTLPFISYGGSSLMVSFLIITILVNIQNTSEASSETMVSSRTINQTSIFQQALPYLTTTIFVGLFSAALLAGWWGVVRGPDLLSRTDNPRRGINDLTTPRGGIYDRRRKAIVESVEQNGIFSRVARYPALGPIIGYNHPVYGQSGLESSLDPILRGQIGNNPFTIWWINLLYGQNPPGINIRLTIDLNLQSTADEMLQGHSGALILLNAENGEILVMASHPTYNPNQLADQWDNLVKDPGSPLINRVTQAVYPIGDLVNFPFIQKVSELGSGMISLRLPLAVPEKRTESTPLEISLAAASISNMGKLPAPILVQFMENEKEGWTLLPTMSSPAEMVTAYEAARIQQNLILNDGLKWGYSHTPDEDTITWYIGGTTLEWKGLPLAIALVIEEADLRLAEDIGGSLLNAAMKP